MTQDDQRIERLEAALATQQAEIERLRTDLASVGGPGRPAPSAPASSARSGGGRRETADSNRDGDQPRSSRRTMLRGGAVAAGAAIAGVMVTPDTAAADDGGEMIIGGNNASAGGDTRIRTAAPGALLSNRNILTVSDNLTSSAYEAAIGAVAQGERITNGLYGYTEARVDDDTSTGHAVVARKASGGRSAVYMPPSAAAPTTDTIMHARGELRVDFGANLWYCVASGTPGVWRRLSGPGAAGAVFAIDPKRTYDSRFVDGPLATGDERLLSVANAIDVETGAIVQNNIVPDGATAIFFNLAITQTTGVGFLQLAPGDATVVTAATINWSEANQTLSNASFSSLDDSRQVKILSGGEGGTHFIIDITGYTI